MRGLLNIGVAALLALGLSGCGFHPRGSVSLPVQMKRTHLTVNGDQDLRRRLSRALELSGVTLEQEAGTGIAELKLSNASFHSESMALTGYTATTEYALYMNVSFELEDGAGRMLLPPQQINMSREYTYDATNTIGSTSQVEELQKSLRGDMVQSILFRLQALARHAAPPTEAAKPATSNPQD